MPTAERERSTGIPVQGQIRALFETLERLTSQIADLREFVDSNDEETREIMASVSGTVQALKTIIYGNEDFRLTGIADRIKSIETDVGEMTASRRNEKLSERFVEVEKSVAGLVKDRQSLIDQLKGMKIILGLGIVSAAGVPSLVTAIMELLKP